MPDSYWWAYKVSANDAKNYNDRQDKTLDYFFYDWDQNMYIEAFYQSLLKDGGCP